MQPAHAFDLAALEPPPAPPQTHHDLLEGLPRLEPGAPKDRLERARAHLLASRAVIERHHLAGAAGLSVCRLLTEGSDRLVRGLFEELAAEQELPSGVALTALGGYGRRELSPHSDLDLLLLIGPDVPRGSQARLEAFSSAFSTLLWDCKLVVGWAARTADECARAAEDDHTVRTALLDSRLLAGSSSAFEHLTRHVLNDLLTHRADAFIADKAREMRERREKYGDSVFLLEPNLKSGQGGLRDLEGALWIAQARFRTRGLRGLLQGAVLPAREVAALESARDFLLRCRNHLHYVRGRKEDRLTFELQEAVSGFLGYRDEESAGLAVEQFMRHYYLSATVIRRAADSLVARCEEASSHRPRLSLLPDRRLGPFKIFRGKLTLDGGPELITREPANAVRLFRVAEEQRVELYSWAKDQLRAHLHELGLARGSPAVVAELKALFVRPGSRGEFLGAMHELGVLGVLIPEFGRITAHHQHDLYHVYTVDIHSLFAVKRLFLLREGALDDEEPIIAREMRALDDPLPLYLGMLLHDAGKGMGGDHSRRGEELATAMAQRLDLSPRQTELVRFLVLHHLSMSRTSQRRDLSDPELIAEFARTCGDTGKLTCLFLLTYSDICSVGPQMWTDWKRRLLIELFLKARDWLEGAQGPDPAGLLAQARAAFLERWRPLGEERAAALLRSLPERYFVATDPRLALKHARLLRRAVSEPFAALLQRRREAGTSELTVAAKDRPGLLSAIAGVLAAHRIDILAARIVSTEDGLALDAFEVRGPQGLPLERSRFHAARGDLRRVLSGAVTVAALIDARRPNRALAAALPRVPTKVSFDNLASRRFTVIDVRAEDRVGLLHAIAGALHEAGAEIALARIATEGNRAVDAFYVQIAGRKLADDEAARLCGRIDQFLKEDSR